ASDAGPPAGRSASLSFRRGDPTVAVLCARVRHKSDTRPPAQRPANQWARDPSRSRSPSTGCRRRQTTGPAKARPVARPWRPPAKEKTRRVVDSGLLVLTPSIAGRVPARDPAGATSGVGVRRQAIHATPASTPSLNHDFDQRANLARRKNARRTHDVDASFGGRIVDQHWHQRAGGDVLVDEEVGNAAMPMPASAATVSASPLSALKRPRTPTVVILPSFTTRHGSVPCITAS